MVQISYAMISTKRKQEARNDCMFHYASMIGNWFANEPSWMPSVDPAKHTIAAKGWQKLDTVKAYHKKQGENFPLYVGKDFG